MKIFITGTDTNIGKTLISSWICLHSGYEYFKPIQAGNIEITDKKIVRKLSASKVHNENFIFKAALSPHLAAKLENKTINIEDIKLPTAENLLIEGAGGVLVPINENFLIIDLIKKLGLPVIIVASSKLGTINHTCLTIEALRNRKIPILGIIMNGPSYPANKAAIEYYGKIKVLAEFPELISITKEQLINIPLSENLKQALCLYKI